MFSDVLIQAMKPVAAAVGIHSSEDLWRGVALRQYETKLRTNNNYREWMRINEARWIAGHWGHYQETDKFSLAHVSSQLYEITEMLRRRIGAVENQSVLDAGASDGMFLSLLGVKKEKGTGVNFLSACVEKIQSDGYTAHLADLEHLPFPDKQFDHVICCETLEHVLNPLATLNELARVSRGRIFLTIPWLPVTRVNARPRGWPQTESHVFEFSPTDFEKIVTFSSLKIVHRDFIHVFPEPRNPLSRWCLQRWMYPNFFPKLQYYELETTVKQP